MGTVIVGIIVLAIAVRWGLQPLWRTLSLNEN